MTFEEVPHTADVKIRAHSPTIEALFSDALDALMQVMFGDSRQGTLVKEISIDSDNLESLLFDFLSEVLFVSETERIVFSKAVIRINSFSLHATLVGEPFDRMKHAHGTEVKGISYHGLAIRSNANGYMLDIVFDV
jgi:SHS2 domain-containing protein